MTACLRYWMKLLLGLLPLLGSEVSYADVRGVVKDARSGEALSKAKVLAGEETAVSDPEGRFSMAGAAGELLVSLVGYRTLRVVVGDPTRELELLLTPDGLSQKDSMEVREGPFEPRDAASPSERTLRSAELRNLAGVIVNDPLRAVQSLPGVASTSRRASPYEARTSGEWGSTSMAC
jgi:hypothetical protein